MPNARITMTVDGQSVEFSTQHWREAAESMPTIETEQQQGLFSDLPLPIRVPPATGCVGGCDRELIPGDLKDTPEGPMCERCIKDLYTVCVDCDKMLRYDDWGECDDLRIGPDDKHRCVNCDIAAFSICDRCGRRTPRDGEIMTHPNVPEREYCVSCWQRRWFNCSECNEVVEHRRAFGVPGSSTLLCENCFERRYFQCSCCGNPHPHAAAMGWEGDPFCGGCYGHADVWKVQPWSGRAITFDRVGSKRSFGVELETSRCHEHTNLHGRTEWGCVYECSTPGRELISPILQGDEGLTEIREMCDYARNHDWHVNSSCGLHVHIDARDLSSDQALQVAYAYRRSYPLWKKFVGRDRATNSMCGSPQYSARDIRDTEHIEDFAESRDRFEFVNWRSYLRHGSIEIRMYRGSLRAREVCNWVILHACFVDAVKDMTFDEIDEVIGATTRKNWIGLVNLIGNPNLLDYWCRKAREHGTELPLLWNGETEPPAPRPRPDRPRAAPANHCGNEDCQECNEEYGELYYE